MSSPTTSSGSQPVHDRPTEIPTRDNWDKHWNDYAQAAGLNPACAMRYARIVELLGRNMRGTDIRILDIGSGVGDLLRELSHHFPTARLAGVDISQEGVDITRRKVPEADVLREDLLEPSLAWPGSTSGPRTRHAPRSSSMSTIPAPY